MNKRINQYCEHDTNQPFFQISCGCAWNLNCDTRRPGYQHRCFVLWAGILKATTHWEVSGNLLTLLLHFVMLSRLVEQLYNVKLSLNRFLSQDVFSQINWKRTQILNYDTRLTSVSFQYQHLSFSIWLSMSNITGLFHMTQRLNNPANLVHDEWAFICKNHLPQMQ